MVNKFVITLLALGSTFIAGAQTATTNTRTFSFHPVGLGSTETMQVNIFNAAANSTSGTAASCTGNVSFLGSTGAAIGAAIGTATSFTATAGQVASVSLPFARAGISGSRGVVRAVIQFTFTSGVPCSPNYSLETFETSSGATHLSITGAGVPGGQGGFGR